MQIAPYSLVDEVHGNVWAIRRYARCLSCVPRLSGAITEEECVKLGFLQGESEPGAEDGFSARDRFEWWIEGVPPDLSRSETLWVWLTEWELLKG
jgi:hypothetical protein